MRNVSRDQVVANFEELVADNQIQTAVELLVAAEPDDQLILIEQSNPSLLERLFEALPADDGAEVTAQLVEEARQSLARVLQRGNALPAAKHAAQALDDFLAARAAEELAAGRHQARPAAEEALALGVASPRRRQFTIMQGRLSETRPGSEMITVYSNPTAQEQRALVEVFGIDEHTLASALDPDEISRLEYDEDTRETFIVWTRPRRGTNDPELLGLASMGFFLSADHLTIVTEDEAPLLRVGDRADSLQNLVLRIMASTVNEFLVELKTIKRASQDIGQKLSRALENRQLLKMFDLSEGLVYHINALDANGGVLRRLRALSQRIGLNEAGVEFLDDIIVDNTQCIRQGQTFSTILAGLMDARGNLINNNMNVLLKNLTIINVVFLPLGVIASMGGMSEYTMILDHYGVSWQAGYAVFAAVTIVVGYVSLKGVKFWIDRMFAK
jgi:magnesium transporter